MKKALSILLVAVMVCSLVACAGGSTSSSTAPASSAAAPASSAAANNDAAAPQFENVELEYWFEGAGPERTPIHEGIINGFNDLNNGIKVTGVYVDLTNGNEKVSTAFAGGMLPDVIYAQDTWKSMMTAQGMVVQLDDRFAAWDEHTQFTEPALMRDRWMDSERRLFFIPCATNVTGIWYRQDVFKDKGVEAPTTWENFFNGIETLTYTEGNSQYYGYTLRGGQGSTNLLINMLECYVGMDDYWSADGKAQILRSAEAEEFVNRMVNIFQSNQAPESSLTASFNEMVADFNAGIAMMMNHNLGSYENQRKTFSPDQYAFLPFPTAINGKLTEEIGSVKSLCISVHTKNEDAAWEYVKWNASHAAISAMNEAVGELPTRIDAASDDWVKNAPHMSNLPAYQAAEKQSIMTPRYLPDYNSITKEFAEPNYQAVLAGKMSAREFLDSWADLLEAAYADYQANA